MSLQFSPPSSPRKFPPFPASMFASPRAPSAPKPKPPTRPTPPLGSPCPTSRFHVAPSSPERYSPLPGPPLVKLHGVRCASHRAANRMCGLFGSNTRSIAPVLLSLNKTFDHVLPPSFERNTPRISFGP